ncbi:ABC transporter substrate-binding protein [Synechocystis sp. LKSZ1]|uniref:ABC transporter substrate-binding protein n=1 Tax=Synechocystis sp. LKSZ1 TaxID=3144951 RepID=UPI00336BF32A
MAVLSSRAVPLISSRWGVRALLVLLLLLTWLSLWSCGRSADAPANLTRNPEMITIGTTLKPRTLDPADSYEVASLLLAYNLGETLYTYKPGTTELQPLLAQALPRLSEDGLTYTIPLRQGVKFHDGTPFDAQAMAFSLQRFMENGGKPSFLLTDTVAKVAATSDGELVITLKKPFAAFPALLAFPGTAALSPQAYEIGAGKFKPDGLVGTGPYRLVSMTNDSLRLAAFADYWGTPAKNQGIDLQLYPGNPANLFNAFRTRAVDVAYQSLVPQQVKQLQADAQQGQGQVIEAPGSVVNFLTLNLQGETLQNKLVRQAVATLIDRQFLNQRVLQGQGEPVYSLVPTSFAAYQPVFQQQYPQQNLAQAKAWLRQAGYSPEKPAKVEIWHSSGSITSSIVAALLKALAKRDLEGMIEFQPNSIAAAAYFKNVSRGLYESAISNWYPDFLDPDNYLYPFLSCAKGSPQEGCLEGGSQNQGSFYYSKEMNQLLDQERQTLDPAERQAIFAKIQTRLAEDVPYIPLWQSKDFAFAQNDIQGVVINPSQTFPFWTIERRSQASSGPP